MKNIGFIIKFLSALFLCSLLVVSFTSCSLFAFNTLPNDTTMDSVKNEPSTKAPETTEAEETTKTEETTNPEETTEPPALLPLPDGSMEFTFMSGAGAWRTVLVLNDDGTFTGTYLDSEMGEAGDGYPNGSAYICNFTGRFTDIEKIHEFSYKMTLSQLTTEKPVGEEWIEDGIRYIASEPNGLVGGTEFAFYLPTTPIANMSEDFLFWWPLKYEHNTSPKETLSYYGIMNVATYDGFFGGY